MAGHEHSRVVLGGRYGKPGRQRQLYVCDMPKPGSSASSHRFAAPLPRPHPAMVPVVPSVRVGPDVEVAEELRTARHYQFTAQDVAAGLVAVSRGVSYAEAGREVRDQAAHRWGTADAGPARRHGTLVSDWVEVYAEALWQAQAPHREDWPDTVLVGVLPLTVRRPGRTRSDLVFSVFTAMAYQPDGSLRIFDIRTASGTGAAHWGRFLTVLTQGRAGRPARIVGDGSAGLARAVARTWPGADAPTVWVDEHLMREAAQRILRERGLDGRDRPLWGLLLRAWRDPADWAAFTEEAHRYRLPELDRWLARVGPTMAHQFAQRDPAVRRSRQELRATLRELESRLGSRRTTFGNRARTDRLLLLMGLDLSGLGRVNSWAQLICVWLEQGNGRPATAQRGIVDRGGHRSMRSAGSR